MPHDVTAVLLEMHLAYAFMEGVGTCAKIIVLGSAYLQVNNQLLIIC